jgi:hypothetical protein
MTTTGAKMLLMADKNPAQLVDLPSNKQMTADEYAMSLLESSDSNNRNRIKSNHQYGGHKRDSIDYSDKSGKIPDYLSQSEKFSQHLLVNSDSHTDIATNKVLNEENSSN